MAEMDVVSRDDEPIEVSSGLSGITLEIPWESDFSHRAFVNLTSDEARQLAYLLRTEADHADGS